MTFGLTWLDAVLLVLLVVFFAQGWRRGFGVVVGGLLGFAAGAAIAFHAAPVVAEWAVGTGWRWAVVLAAVLLLVASGQHVGAALGAQVRRRLGPPVLRRVDGLLGGVAAVLVAALVMGLLSFSLGALGSTATTREVARSRVLTAVDAAMPDVVLAWAARSRAAVAGLDGLPQLRLPAPGSGDAPARPDPVRSAPASSPSASPAPSVRAAPAPSSSASAPAPSRSVSSAPSSATPSSVAPAPAPAPAADISRAVVRLTGTAAACAQVQSGSGVAITPDRVLTNAHVVAGVPAPTVLDRDRGVHEARVVLLDPVQDLAVLAVDGADLPVARLGEELRAGDAAVAMGYPDSGPFATTGARVQAVGEVPLEAVGGGAVTAVDVYTLAADIRHGYSGGPVVAADGTLAGLVFARAPGDAEIGYALTADALADAVAAASGLSAAVPAGECVAGG